MGFLNQIIERVASIQQGISGITQAYPYAPASPTALDVPFFVNEVIPSGNRSQIAAVTGQQEMDFKINMILCYAPVQSDYNIQLVEANTLTWVDIVYQTFAGHVQLRGDLYFLHDAFIMDWGGPGEYSIGDTVWSALRFTLRTRLFYPQTVAP